MPRRNAFSTFRDSRAIVGKSSEINNFKIIIINIYTECEEPACVQKVLQVYLQLSSYICISVDLVWERVKDALEKHEVSTN